MPAIEKSERTPVSEILAEAERAYEGGHMTAAVQLFTELAEKDVPEACQYLGLIYRTGDSVPKDDKKANFWYSKYTILLKRMAASGDLDSAVALGKLYQYGEYVVSDPKKAVALFVGAADAGHSPAQFHLATLYRHGWCQLPQDEKQYRSWLLKAAEGGHAEAMHLHGLDLIGVGRRAEGMNFICRAADAGFWPAKESIEKLRSPRSLQ